MDIRPVSPETKHAILHNFVQIPRAKQLSQFCVDGRKGQRVDDVGTNLAGPYMQALGGSFHLAALKWIMEGGSQPYNEVIGLVFATLRENGYRLSAHTGHHGDGKTKSDCGFDDNFGKIVSVLSSQADQIWNTIISVAPALVSQRSVWDEVIKKVEKVITHLDTVPSGHDMVVGIAKNKYGADIQSLEGDHKEVAAVVNLKRNTTLDVDRNQDVQAFNLDLWYVLDQAKDLGLDVDRARLLSLGLYVATEKVLVEDKRGYGIPIIVNA